MIEVNRKGARLSLRLLLDDGVALHTINRGKGSSYGSASVYFFSPLSGQVHDITEQVAETLEWQLNDAGAVLMPVPTKDPGEAVVEALGYQLGYSLERKAL